MQAALLAIALAVGGCQATQPSGTGLEQPDTAKRASVWSVEAGRFLAWEELPRALASARYVLLGELHDSPHHHRLQAGLLRGLVSRGRRPAVVFEMLSADDEEPLREALAAPRPTAEDLRRAVAWDASGWPAWELYAPVFEAALEAGLPIVPGDMGQATRNALRQEGLAGLAPHRREALGLTGAAPAAARRVLGAAIREGHCGLLPEAALPRMIEIQRARDAHLALALHEAAARPGSDGAVLIAGAGHARSDVAVPAWLRELDPTARTRSVGLLEAEPRPSQPQAWLEERYPAGVPFDFVVFTPRTPREDPCEALRRRLEAPANASS